MSASPPVVLQKKLQSLTSDWVKLIDWRMEWLETAHDYQVPPDWQERLIWLMMAGRGAGKTRTASQEVGWWALTEPGTRTLLTAPTASDVRDTCIEGDSGLLKVIPSRFIKTYNRSLNEIVTTTGSVLKGIPGSEPARYRGPQFHFSWYDEIAAFDRLDDAWSLSRMGLRLGDRTRTMLTTTPKPVPLLKKLVEREAKDVYISRATSYQNLVNLSDNFKDELLQYAGTEYGRQEIDGELLDFSDAGILKKSWFRLFPAGTEIPELLTVVVSMDTAFTDKTENDRTACTVWGVFNRHGTTNALLLDCWAERLNYPDLRQRAREAWKTSYADQLPSVFLMEDKGSGISLRQELISEGIPVVPYNPGRADKIQRAHTASPIFKDGFVWLPESKKNPGQPMTWTDELLDEITMFPRAEHDDYVDTVTQAINYLRDQGYLRSDLKVIDLEEDYDYYAKKPKANPYAV